MNETTPLYGEQQFPLAVAAPSEEDVGRDPTPSMLHAAMFAKAIGSRWPFGCSNAQSAAALRSIADAIEKGEVAVQSAEVQSHATTDDYTFTSLVLSFAQKIPPE